MHPLSHALSNPPLKTSHADHEVIDFHMASLLKVA